MMKRKAMVAGNTQVDGPRSKRSEILAAAVDNFGRIGYEHTKWATVAQEVGIGQTALYHYFESKAHCLLTIMCSELERNNDVFAAAVEAADGPEAALKAAVESAYAITQHEALQARILFHHIEILASPRASEKEEDARLRARELVRVIERDWRDLINRGMETGDFANRDEIQMGRLVLGLINSVWNWYRPRGSQSLDEIATEVAGACLRVVQ